jgi:hypothetical protein
VGPHEGGYYREDRRDPPEGGHYFEDREGPPEGGPSLENPRPRTLSLVRSNVADYFLGGVPVALLMTVTVEACMVPFMSW